MYEANISLMVQGIKAREQYFQNHIDDGPRENGFAQIYSFGHHESINYIAMELLGPSLDDL